MTAYWTRERIVEALAVWIAEHGRTPRQGEWKQTGGKAWPSEHTVRRVFGTWGSLLDAAGVDAAGRDRYWTRESVIAAIRAWAAEYGRTPASISDWGRAAPGHPAAPTVTAMFGSWNAGMRAAGLTPNHSGARARWTRDTIAAVMLDWLLEHGRWPTGYEWTPPCPLGSRPQRSRVCAVFGTWAEAKRAAGWTHSCACCEKRLSGLQRRWCSERCRRAGQMKPVPVVSGCAGCGGEFDNVTSGCFVCHERKRKRALRVESVEFRERDNARRRARHQSERRAA